MKKPNYHGNYRLTYNCKYILTWFIQLSYSESLNPPWKEIISYGVAELSMFFQPGNYGVFGPCAGAKPF